MNAKEFERLNDSNWNTWKDNVILALKVRKVWKFVDPNSAATGDEDQNTEALAVIRFSMSSDQMKHLGAEQNPREAWKKLIKVKESNTGMLLVQKLTKLVNMKQGDTTSMTTHCAEMKEVMREVTDLTKSNEDFIRVLFASLLIRSINDRYDAFKVHALQTEASKLEFEEIYQRAVLEEQRQNDRTASLNESEYGPAWANYAKTSVNKAKNRSCQHLNHSAEECWQLHPHLRPKQFNKKQSANFSEVHYATTSIATLTTPMPSNQWLIDSGATAHVCYDRSMFSRIRPIDPTSIELGEGNVIQAKEAGDIDAKVVLNNSEFDFTFRNVLFAPDMKRNLISMISWIKQGVTYEVNTGGQCIIKLNNKNIGYIKERNNLLIVTMTPLNKSDSVRATYSAAGQIRSSESKYAAEQIRFSESNNSAAEQEIQ